MILWLVSHINLFYKLHGLNLFDQIEKSWNLHQQITPSVFGNKLLLLTKKWKKKHTNHPDNYVFQIFDPPYQSFNKSTKSCFFPSKYVPEIGTFRRRVIYFLSEITIFEKTHPFKSNNVSSIGKGETEFFSMSFWDMYNPT